MQLYYWSKRCARIICPRLDLKASYLVQLIKSKTLPAPLAGEEATP